MAENREEIDLNEDEDAALDEVWAKRTKDGGRKKVGKEIIGAMIAGMQEYNDDPSWHDELEFERSGMVQQPELPDIPEPEAAQPEDPPPGEPEGVEPSQESNRPKPPTVKRKSL